MSRIVVTSDEFLNSPVMARQILDVPVPELGEGKVIPVWGMTPRERSEFEDRVSRMNTDDRKKAKLQVRERMAVECCRNDDGIQLFTSDQIEQLATRRADVFERIVNVALELSGFNAEDVDTLAKKLEPAPEG